MIEQRANARKENLRLDPVLRVERFAIAIGKRSDDTFCGNALPLHRDDKRGASSLLFCMASFEPLLEPTFETTLEAALLCFVCLYFHHHVDGHNAPDPAFIGIRLACCICKIHGQIILLHRHIRLDIL